MNAEGVKNLRQSLEAETLLAKQEKALANELLRNIELIVIPISPYVSTFESEILYKLFKVYPHNFSITSNDHLIAAIDHFSIVLEEKACFDLLQTNQAQATANFSVVLRKRELLEEYLYVDVSVNSVHERIATMATNIHILTGDQMEALTNFNYDNSVDNIFLWVKGVKQRKRRRDSVNEGAPMRFPRNDAEKMLYMTGVVVTFMLMMNNNYLVREDQREFLIKFLELERLQLVGHIVNLYVQKGKVLPEYYDDDINEDILVKRIGRVYNIVMERFIRFNSHLTISSTGYKLNTDIDLLRNRAIIMKHILLELDIRQSSNMRDIFDFLNPFVQVVYLLLLSNTIQSPDPSDPDKRYDQRTEWIVLNRYVNVDDVENPPNNPDGIYFNRQLLKVLEIIQDQWESVKLEVTLDLKRKRNRFARILSSNNVDLIDAIVVSYPTLKTTLQESPIFSFIDFDEFVLEFLYVYNKGMTTNKYKIKIKKLFEKYITKQKIADKMKEKGIKGFGVSSKKNKELTDERDRWIEIFSNKNNYLADISKPFLNIIPLYIERIDRDNLFFFVADKDSFVEDFLITFHGSKHDNEERRMKRVLNVVEKHVHDEIFEQLIMNDPILKPKYENASKKATIKRRRLLETVVRVYRYMVDKINSEQTQVFNELVSEQGELLKQKMVPNTVNQYFEATLPNVEFNDFKFYFRVIGRTRNRLTETVVIPSDNTTFSNFETMYENSDNDDTLLNSRAFTNISVEVPILNVYFYNSNYVVSEFLKRFKMIMINDIVKNNMLCFLVSKNDDGTFYNTGISFVCKQFEQSLDDLSSFEKKIFLETTSNLADTKLLLFDNVEDTPSVGLFTIKDRNESEILLANDREDDDDDDDEEGNENNEYSVDLVNRIFVSLLENYSKERLSIIKRSRLLELKEESVNKSRELSQRTKTLITRFLHLIKDDTYNSNPDEYLSFLASPPNTDDENYMTPQNAFLALLIEKNRFRIRKFISKDRIQTLFMDAKRRVTSGEQPILTPRVKALLKKYEDIIDAVTKPLVYDNNDEKLKKYIYICATTDGEKDMDNDNLLLRLAGVDSIDPTDIDSVIARNEDNIPSYMSFLNVYFEKLDTSYHFMGNLSYDSLNTESQRLKIVSDTDAQLLDTFVKWFSYDAVDFELQNNTSNLHYMLQINDSFKTPCIFKPTTITENGLKVYRCMFSFDETYGFILNSDTALVFDLFGSTLFCNYTTASVWNTDQVSLESIEKNYLLDNNVVANDIIYVLKDDGFSKYRIGDTTTTVRELVLVGGSEVETGQAMPIEIINGDTLVMQGNIFHYGKQGYIKMHENFLSTVTTPSWFAFSYPYRFIVIENSINLAVEDGSTFDVSYQDISTGVVSNKKLPVFLISDNSEALEKVVMLTPNTIYSLDLLTTRFWSPFLLKSNLFVKPKIFNSQNRVDRYDLLNNRVRKNIVIENFKTKHVLNNMLTVTFDANTRRFATNEEEQELFTTNEENMEIDVKDYQNFAFANGNLDISIINAIFSDESAERVVMVYFDVFYSMVDDMFFTFTYEDSAQQG